MNLIGKKTKSLSVKIYKTDKNKKILKDSLNWKVLEKFDEAGRTIESDKFGDHNVFNYNSKGHLIEKAHIEEGVPGRREVYKYDQQGKVIEIERLGSKSDSILSKTVFKYNNTGQQIEKDDCNDKGIIGFKSSYKYIVDIEQLEIDENLNSSGNITFKYFTNGLVTEEDSYDKAGGLGFKTLYKYDKQNNLVEQALYGAENNLLYKDIFEYDNKGNKIEEITDSGTVRPTKSTFEYSAYDKHGNWCQAIWFNGKEKKRYVVEREITYYP